jgi:hypothetical protein
MKTSKILLWLALGLLVLSWHRGTRADVTLVSRGQVRTAIHVPAGLLDSAGSPDSGDRKRLRASVDDLAHYLKRMSGAVVDVVEGMPPPDATRIPILIGALATQRFGPTRTRAPVGQGFRVDVTSETIGLHGESDLSTSYAIYELLDQQGCRWYMPSPQGEVIPTRETVVVREQKLDTAPFTVMRSIWHADEDYRRRNRLGGQELSTHHALEGYITPELLEEHPEWRAVGVDGQHQGRRLKFSMPGVAEAIAAHLIRRLDADPSRRTLSLSPDDGPANGWGFDSTDDLRIDAGDWDPTMPGFSHTDRLVWFCNRIAERVVAKHPDVTFGMLAYRNYNRPPVREKLHPSIVPQIAPLSYSRAHPWTDDGEPNNETMRYIVRGWAQAAARVSYYVYGYFWPELSTPNPFITKWSVNVPMALKEGKCKFWQPETLPNFDTTLHALYLGIRLSWNPDQEPADILRELHRLFYGHASREMAAYWHFIDECWVATPEYSGGGYGHLRRFPPDRMAHARQLMDAALAAAKTQEEIFRVRMADDSLRQFELFMKMRHDLAAGRFGRLGRDAARWRQRASALAEKYQAQFAFGRVLWDEGNSIYGRLFRKLYQRTYDDAERIATEYTILTQPPLRFWRYRLDPKDEGEGSGWAARDFDDDDWQMTDPCLQTMSTLGHHDYRGVSWFRARVELSEIPPGERVYLWVGGVFDEVQPFVNGQSFQQVRSRAFPLSFDITEALRAGATQQLALRCVRAKGRLGLGGLVAPVVVYRGRAD